MEKLIEDMGRAAVYADHHTSEDDTPVHSAQVHQHDTTNSARFFNHGLDD
jgi:hypothetical protein